MSGLWFWNFSFALFGFLLYFFLSVEKKQPMNLLLESFLVFILFYFIMYFVRFLWAYAGSNPVQQKQEIHQNSVEEQTMNVENSPDRGREKELIQLTKQMEEEDVDKVLTYIRNQFQKDRS